MNVRTIVLLRVRDMTARSVVCDSRVRTGLGALAAEKVCTAAHMAPPGLGALPSRVAGERGRGVSEVEARAGLAESRRSRRAGWGQQQSPTDRLITSANASQIGRAHV